MDIGLVAKMTCSSSLLPSWAHCSSVRVMDAATSHAKSLDQQDLLTTTGGMQVEVESDSDNKVCLERLQHSRLNNSNQIAVAKQLPNSSGLAVQELTPYGGPHPAL